MSYAATAKGTHRCMYCGKPVGGVPFDGWSTSDHAVVCERGPCLGQRVQALGMAEAGARTVAETPGMVISEGGRQVPRRPGA